LHGYFSKAKYIYFKTLPEFLNVMLQVLACGLRQAIAAPAGRHAFAHG
jgi:hypothetical protein